MKPAFPGEFYEAFSPAIAIAEENVIPTFLNQPTAELAYHGVRYTTSANVQDSTLSSQRPEFCCCYN